jgi:single-strand DNA-binding protein
MALNKCIIQGRLTKDVELRYTKSNTPVASFTLAVDRRGKDEGTDFINCVAWNKSAEFVSKYFSKGSEAVVDGRLQMREWTDKDGNKRVSAEVVADNVYFCGSKKNAVQGNVAPNTAKLDDLKARFSEVVDEEDGELPF